MSLSVGIVGLPNVGKSTLFNALLKQQVALAANYPFATIEPNVGVVPVPDQRLEKLAEIVGTTVIKPATVEFVDIAGLVKGASQGEGLGNKFLSHIRETAAICHVVRAFADSDILREGSVSPVEDVQTIRMELQLADLATLQKQPQPKGAVKPDDKERWEIVQECIATIEKEEMIHSMVERIKDPVKKDMYARVVKELGLLTAKPELFVVNVSEDDLATGVDVLTKKYSEELHVAPHQIIVMSNRIESELSSLSTEDQVMYLQDLGLEKSGMERLITSAYTTLNLQSFLTAGELEVRAWTIHKGMSAPEAAGVIHTDFTKHFIKAVVISYEDFVELGGWKKARELGKVRTEGKEYIMREGDVVEFMIGK